VRRVIAQATWPLGTALAGWAGATFSPGIAIALFGAVSLVYLSLQLISRDVMQLEETIHDAYAAPATAVPSPAAAAPGSK